jgi:hypothetical protein
MKIWFKRPIPNCAAGDCSSRVRVLELEQALVHVCRSAERLLEESREGPSEFVQVGAGYAGPAAHIEGPEAVWDYMCDRLRIDCETAQKLLNT